MEREVKGFRTLNALKKAYELTLVVYQLSKKLPQEELYGLSSPEGRSISAGKYRGRI